MNSPKDFKEVKIYSAVFWYILTMSIVVFIAIIIGNKSLLKNDNLLSLISTTLFIFILFYKFRVSKNKVSLLFQDYIRKINYKEIFSVVATQLCLSTGISLLIIGIVYYKFPQLLNGFLEESSISSYSTYSGLLIAMLITVVAAPLSEELLFRAIIFKRTSKIFNIYIGMIVSSLVFGLLHIELAILGAFLFGIACCTLYVKYKNILIPMTVHFLNNLIAFLPQADLSPSNTSAPYTDVDAKVSLILGSVLFIIGMFFFIRFLIKNKEYLKKEFIRKSKIEINNNLF